MRPQIFICTFVLSCLSSLSTDFADAPSATSTVLIYCDLSGGALFLAKTHYRVSIAEKRVPTLVSHSVEFVAQLAKGRWDDVIIVVKWTSDEPSWVDELRKFSTSHPEIQIAVSTWHDAGQTVPTDFVTRATVGTSYWRCGYSNIGYVSAREDKRENKVVLKGFLWPTFDRIEPMDPERLAKVSSPLEYIRTEDEVPNATSQSTRTTSKVRCEQKALSQYRAECIRCLRVRDEMETNCFNSDGAKLKRPLIAPQEKTVKCLIDATDAFKMGIEAAINLYYNRFNACQGTTTKPSI